ncbi:hypothetical protein PanWU01x14_126120 [Parasponia andersonii]|uniref:Zinc finger, CCHC-type n=1 Tax=Parasponia andersonii TaxID=3476 RepID=A0A2P5CTC0_PARAD|nr:hypothetical protein PanWU01x14_126120 [Parasponia andersonii]
MANNNADVVNAENMANSQQPIVASAVAVPVPTMARVLNPLVTPMVPAAHYGEKFLAEEAPKVREDEQDFQVLTVVDDWKQSNYLCRNYVMNGLTNSLCSVYRNKKTTKKLWESLDHKHTNEDAGSNKFMVGCFLDYKIVNSKTVCGQIQVEGMVICEPFQVATIIEKLPPSWKNFKSYLKYKRKAMNLEDLVIRLCIEEDNRRAEKTGVSSSTSGAKANVVEYDHSSKTNKNKSKKESKLGPKGGVGKKQKFKENALTVTRSVTELQIADFQRRRRMNLT